MKWRWNFVPGTLGLREAGFGMLLFTSKEPEEWTWHLENLGRQCGEAWRVDLFEEDRAWAAAHRKKFSRWTDEPRTPGTVDEASADARQRRAFAGVPVPPWPMLLEAVQSAFFAFLEAFKKEPSDANSPAPPDPVTRLHRSYLWRRLTADDAAGVDRAEALHAFRRGYRLGRRGKPKTLARPIPPMLNPLIPWRPAAMPELPGPSAARERALRALPFPEDRKELAAREEELRALYASAWREDVPEEDRIWAAVYRDTCTMSVNLRRRDALAQSAYEGYLQSSDGRFNGEPAPPWGHMNRLVSDPWRYFVDRVEEAPEGESEVETADAAVWEFWDTLYREAPPWESDPDQAHWVAAVRAVRAKALADDVPPENVR